MVKEMIDTGTRRDIVLLYGDKFYDGFAYRNLLEKAERDNILRAVYVASDEKSPNSHGIKLGLIDWPLIRSEIPDWPERRFYISGPHAMVAAFKNTLRTAGVMPSRIKTDYFPGFA